jgi:hypothetical protein
MYVAGDHAGHEHRKLVTLVARQICCPIAPVEPSRERIQRHSPCSAKL